VIPEHLWEINHPYYSSESNYYCNAANHPGSDYGSWQEFFEAEGDNDKDLNLLFRWDWDPNEYLDVPFGVTREDEIAVRREYADRFGDRDHAWTLKLFFISQRKGIYRPVTVQVCKADEPAVREFLQGYADHLRAVWEPIWTVTP